MLNLNGKYFYYGMAKVRYGIGMETSDAFTKLVRLRERAREELETAMKAGQMSGVIKFARIIKEADEALQGMTLAVERIAGRLETDQDVSAPAPQQPSSPSSSAKRSWREQGNACRDEYLRGLRTKGIELRRLRGRLFQTASGKRVGISYASERQPDKWWMGLPDEHYDIVILLCQTSTGETLDFVLPPDFVNKVWDRLSSTNKASKKQREWHVHRSGPNYELEPKAGLGHINSYLSKLDPVK